jgi:hypothetical protein
MSGSAAHDVGLCRKNLAKTYPPVRADQGTPAFNVHTSGISRESHPCACARTRSLGGGSFHVARWPGTNGIMPLAVEAGRGCIARFGGCPLLSFCKHVSGVRPVEELTPAPFPAHR